MRLLCWHWTCGWRYLSRLADSLGYSGTLVTFGVLSGKPATLDTRRLIGNDIRLRGFWLAKWFLTATTLEKQAAFGEVIPLIADGTLKADIDSRFTIDEIKQAVLRSSEVQGMARYSSYQAPLTVGV